MAMHLLKLCLFLFLFLNCINLTTSKTYPKPFFQTSLPSTFFAIASAPAPSPAPTPTPNNNIPTTPSPLPQVPPSAHPPNWVPPPLPPPPTADDSSGGLSGGQKAGITIGTLAGAGLLVFAGMVYKKRRSNIRRARFGSAARRPAL